MPKKIQDLTGRRFGAWTVVGIAKEQHRKGHAIYWDCVCDCGTKASIAGYSLKAGDSRSCGCGSYKAKEEQHQPHWVEADFEKMFDVVLKRCELNTNLNEKIRKEVINALKLPEEEAIEIIVQLIKNSIQYGSIEAQETACK